MQPVLAQDLPKISEQAQRYTVTLKKGLKWHDGEDITADDIVFTIEAIQNPQARSPLRAAWQGVSVEKVNDYTVTFTLSTNFAPFIVNLTQAIVPEHLLQETPPSQLEDSNFNYQPVGSGPFIFSKLITLVEGDIIERESRVQLLRNQDYFDQENKFSLDTFYFWIVPNRQR